MARYLGAGVFALATLLTMPATAKQCVQAWPLGTFKVIETCPPGHQRVIKRKRPREIHKARRKAVSRRPAADLAPQTDNDGRLVFAGDRRRAPRSTAVGPGRAVLAQAVVPSRFIRGALMCARNVNAALAARGIRGTGTDWAKDFLKWGRSTGPVPGAVAVFHRGRHGGHAAIVHSVTADGTVIYLNPSSSRAAWEVGPYHKRPIDFRAPG